MNNREQHTGDQMSRIERLFGDLETFDLILDRVLRDWGGQGTVIPRDRPRRLFDNPKTFEPLCKEIRAIEGGEELCWKCNLERAEEVAKEGRPIDYICDNGLLDITVPIIVRGQSIATILFGQCRVSDDPDFEPEAIANLRRAERKLGLQPGSLQEYWEQVKTVTRVEVEQAKAEVNKIAKFIAEIVTEREELQIRSQRFTELERQLGGLALSNLSETEPVKDFWRVLRVVFPQICSILDAQAGVVLRGHPTKEEAFTIQARYPSTNRHLRELYPVPESKWQTLIRDGVVCVANLEESDRQYELRLPFEESELVHPRETEIAIIPMQVGSHQAGRVVLAMAGTSPPESTDLVPWLPFEQQIDLFKMLGSRLRAAYSSVVGQHERLLHEEQRRQYIQDIMHQLVGPLSGLRAHCEALLHGRVSVQRGRTVLETLVEQAGMLQRYVQNFALAARGRWSIFDASEWNPELCDSQRLVDILIKCTKSFQGQAKAKDLIGPSVNESSFRRFPPLMLDVELFEILILNLCDNAVKYSYESAPITIVGRVLDNRVEIAITNYGIQLKPEEVNMIFQRYYRSPSAVKFAPVATGIGLFICDQVVKLHKGAIRALPSRRSQDGNEVKFIVTLPVAEGQRR
jgi:signal transduction histidine kinase/ligand-binding sensor protein